MTWVTPLLAGIIGAIAVPSLVILYFLKLRRRELEVSTTLLWKKAIQDLQANAPFQRLRRNILLFLQLLVLAAVILALAQPQLAGQSVSASRHIILIDRSASMKTTDGDGPISAAGINSGRPTRLDRAKREARELIDSLPEPGFLDRGQAAEAMLIVFDTTAEVRLQFTRDKSALKGAIDAIEATDAPTLVGEALRLAKAYKPKRRVEDVAVEGLTDPSVSAVVHLWSDGRLPDASEAKPDPGDELVFHKVGQAVSPNIAVTSLRWERSYDEPNKLSVFVGLQSTDVLPRTVDVELSLDGTVAAIKTVQIPAAGRIGDAPVDADPAPGAGGAKGAGTPRPSSIRPTAGSSGLVFDLERAGGASARVRVRAPGLASPPPNDGLELDDQAWMIIPGARRVSVAAVTRGNLFIGAALEGLPLARLDVMAPEEFQRKTLAQQAAYDVIILDGWLPTGAGIVLNGTPPAPGAPPAGLLPSGRYLIFNAVPNGAGVTAEPSTSETQSLFVDWRRDHPVTRNITLDSIVIGGMPTVKIDSSGASFGVALTDKGPGIIDASSETGNWRAVVLPFDVARSNWPFDVSFVVFMASVIDYLGETGASAPGVAIGANRLPPQMVQPGTVLADRLPPGAADARITGPADAGLDSGGAEVTVAPDGRIAFGPVRACGVYTVSWSGQAGVSDRTVGGRVQRQFAANLLDPAESDVSASERVEFASEVVAAQAQSARAERKLWPWLLLGALGIMMLEWFVYNRKVHV